MLRREFLRDGVALLGGASGVAGAATDPPDLRLVVWASERASDELRDHHRRCLDRRVDATLGSLVADVELEIRDQPVEVPDYACRSEVSVARWWKAQDRDRNADSNLLLVGREECVDWEKRGAAWIGGDAAVVGYAGGLNMFWAQDVALHEIGHNLGLSHEYGTVVEQIDAPTPGYARPISDGVERRTVETIMATGTDADGYSLQFSAEAAAELRRRYA